MKSCPTCNRTYPDDTLAFCLIDGSVLSAPYDPAETRRIPATRNTASAVTEVLSDSASRDPRPPLPSTIQAPVPQVPFLHSEGPPPGYSARKSVVPWLLVGFAILLIAIFVVLILATRSSQNQKSANNQSSSKTSTNVVEQSNLACGHTLASALYDKWIQLGGENGKLGCPVTDETEAPASAKGTTGRWIQFARGDGGYLVQHRTGPYAGKVFEVDGCMFKLYASQGGTKSWLGFPIGDGFETSPGGRQEFESGYIVWDSKTYVCQAHMY